MTNRRRLLGWKVLKDLIPISRTEVYRRMEKGTFPRSVKVGFRTAWFEDEVLDWMDELPRS